MKKILQLPNQKTQVSSYFFVEDIEDVTFSNQADKNGKFWVNVNRKNKKPIVLYHDSFDFMQGTLAQLAELMRYQNEETPSEKNLRENPPVAVQPEQTTTAPVNSDGVDTTLETKN